MCFVYFHAFCLQYLSFMWIFVKLWNCVWIWYYEIKRLLFYLTWILRKYEIINSNVWLRKISNCVYASLSPWIILPAKSDGHSKRVGSRERGGGFKTTPSYIHSPRVETETMKFEYKYESTFSIENANLYNFNGNLWFLVENFQKFLFKGCQKT